MTANHQTKITGLFKDGLDQAQARLASLEEEGQKMVQGLRARSKASRKEMAALVSRLQAGELFAPKKVKAWQKQARHVSDDLAHRFDELRARAIAYAGVASREQVHDIARELDKLTRKIDRLIGARKPTNGA